MKNRTSDEVRLKHILDAINKIENFIGNKGFDQFSSDELLQSACIRH